MAEQFTVRYAALLATLPPAPAGLHELGLALRNDFACDRASIFLKASRGVYVSVYAEGLEGMLLSVKPGEGLVGKSIQRREGIISNDAVYDPDSLCRLRDHYTGYETRSLLAVPIPGLFGPPRGAVQLINKLRAPFDAEDARRLFAAARGLKRLHRLITHPENNLWDPRFHKEGLHASSAQA